MDAEAAVVAIDGNAVPPFPLVAWRMGPAMRLDVVVRAPAPGRTARIVDYFAKEPVVLMTLLGDGQAPETGADFAPSPIYAPVLPEDRTSPAKGKRGSGRVGPVGGRRI